MKKLILLSFATTFALGDSLFYENLNKSWNIIKLQKAYNENPAMNGQGLSIGIIDSVFNASHPSLSGKDKGLSNNDFDFKGYINNKKYDNARHGSHVAGIILGSYADTSTEKNPRGIAYGASYYGVGLLNDKQQYNGNLFDEFKDKDIKIINNSWEKQGFYPLINRYFKFAYGYTGIDSQNTASISSDMFFNRILNNNINNTNMKEVRELIELSKQKGILNITASGNDGSLSSGVLASVPSYDESVRAWLVVGALDATNIEEKDGKFTIKTSVSSGTNYKDYYSSGIGFFSNLFKGNTLYALMAPGFNIDSADALFQHPQIQNQAQTKNDKFTEMSGTSQAAPFVSGAALLVQQKFPFLNGVQIADVLLSTANSNVSFEKELLVQSYNGGAFYNVIYIDKDPPKTNDGKIDKEQVKKDLQNLGYTEDGAKKILATLYKTQDAVNNNQINDAEAIVRLNKEEIIGQGILDVQKALKGLARLDANRLNSSDIQNFENEKQAFYTINTVGFNAEFSHNIEQRLWDDKWHIEDALNLPKDMKSISKVGLSKSGLGTLTLSGKNTYEGATKVSQGVLKLAASGEVSGDIAALNEGSFELEGKAKKNAYALQKGRLNIQSGASVEGSVYAKELGRVILNGGSIKNASVDNAFFEFKTGTMTGDFLASNKALLQIPQNAEISGKTTAKSGAIIQLGAVENGINTNAASLSTKEVELLEGGILAGSGTLKGVNSNSFKLQNTAGVVMAGFGADKITSLQKNELVIEGSYAQGGTASLQIAFSGGQNSANNSKITATNYDIKGGELVFVPVYNGGDSRLSAGLSVKLDLGKLNGEVDKFTQIRTQDSNTLIFSYDKATQLLNAKLKDNAYASGDKQVSAVLGQIASSKNLPQKYEDYFGMLDLTDKQIYNESLESLAENATLNGAKNALNNQANLALNNFIFLLEPSNLNYSSASNNYLLAGLDGDLNELVLNEILKELSRENKDEIVLNAKYKYFKRKSFNSDTYASNIAMKRYANDSLLLGTFMDFAYTNSNNKHTQNDNKTLSFGLNALYDLEYFGLLGSSSLGFGFNDTSRNFLMPSGTTTLNGTYNDILLSLQGGIYKDIWLNDFLLKPMALLNFSGIFQEGFKERGVLFAKSYDKATYHNIGSSLGLYSGIKKELANSSLYFGIFNFYNVKFKDNLKNQAHFSDFDNFSFSQKLKTNKHSILSGINAQWQYKRTSAKLELGYEKGEDYQSTGVNLSVGYSF